MATEDNATVQGNTEAVANAEATTLQTTDAQANLSTAPTDTQIDSSKSEDTATENQSTDADYDFTLPEGFTANEELAGDLKALAKENNLSKEVAQKFADLGVKMQQQQAEAWQTQVDQWAEQVKADKELGGEKFNENISLAKQALDKFGGQELKDLLQSTGFGNHPAIVKAFYNIGKSVSNDTLVVSNGSSKSEKSAASIMFPTMN
jgi:thiol:disulfide interchange protein